MMARVVVVVVVRGGVGTKPMVATAVVQWRSSSMAVVVDGGGVFATSVCRHHRMGIDR